MGSAGICTSSRRRRLILTLPWMIVGTRGQQDELRSPSLPELLGKLLLWVVCLALSLDLLEAWHVGDVKLAPDEHAGRGVKETEDGFQGTALVADAGDEPDSFGDRTLLCRQDLEAAVESINDPISPRPILMLQSLHPLQIPIDPPLLEQGQREGLAKTRGILCLDLGGAQQALGEERVCDKIA